MNRQFFLFVLVLVLAIFPGPFPAFSEDKPEKPIISIEEANALVKAAIDYWRDSSSYTEAKMTIHREDWERSSELKSWTKGMDMSLVRFTAPAKDAGNATLSTDDDIWTFTPKTNRVIKIPPSMKSQSWMGSDFSYQDLSKDDEIVNEYIHKIIAEEKHEGKRVAVIESIPKETAPIVWGKEILRIREDLVILQHEFYDQDMQLVKTLHAREIKPLGGKIYATIIRMEKTENPEEWTEVEHQDAKFGLELPKRLFTLSNLRNPRR